MPRKKPPVLSQHDFRPIGEQAMAERPVVVRVPVSIREQVDQLPKNRRSELLRQWIEEGLKQWNEMGGGGKEGE
ncbi:MAG: hypothetical protein KME26_00470 [Oscillatoria princeps RMCB-10]|nr:hypothetical protein [Oscillatoria princeps RMCB-10]